MNDRHFRRGSLLLCEFKNSIYLNSYDSFEGFNLIDYEGLENREKILS
jgi:hypothetical protein